MTSFEVRLISIMVWRAASSFNSSSGSVSYMTSTPWPMRSAWPRSMASRMWKRRPGGWHHGGGKLAGVQRDVDLGVDGSGGSRASASGGGTRPWPCSCLRLDEVEADDIAVAGGNLKGEQRLREDLLGWKGAQNLVKKAYFDRAGGHCLWRVAVLESVARGKRGVELADVGGDDPAGSFDRRVAWRAGRRARRARCRR